MTSQDNVSSPAFISPLFTILSAGKWTNLKSKRRQLTVKKRLFIRHTMYSRMTTADGTTETTKNGKDNRDMMPRRAFVQSAVSGFVGMCAWTAVRPERVEAKLIPLDEAVTILSTVRGDMDDWLALSSGDSDDLSALRRALRAGAASQLRIAARAIPELCPSDKQQQASEARQRTIQAVEAVDLAALRASRKQASETPVAKHLSELSDAIDTLLATVGVEAP